VDYGYPPPADRHLAPGGQLAHCAVVVTAHRFHRRQLPKPPERLLAPHVPGVEDEVHAAKAPKELFRQLGEELGAVGVGDDTNPNHALIVSCRTFSESSGRPAGRRSWVTRASRRRSPRGLTWHGATATR